MEHDLILIITFLNIIFSSISVVQQWNLINSAIDLLSSNTNPVKITVMDETTDDLKVELYKYFSKENGVVVYKKYLKITKNDNIIFNDKVDFDKIKSYHSFDDDIIFCPKGKYHPLSLNFQEFRRRYDNSLNENEDWELECINYNQNYFMIFYLSKDKYHIFYKKTGTDWQYAIKYGTIYSVKLLNNKIGEGDIDFTLAYIVNESGSIQLILESYKIKENGDLDTKNTNSIELMNDKTNTKGIFENNNEHFYFLTYTDTFNFACGYYDSTNNIDNINFQEN